MEIPLDVDVFLGDTLTTNNFISPGQVRRLLVGRYADPELGLVQATAFTQLIPTSVAALPESAVFDTAILQLALDYYYYGDASVANQEFQVHELLDTIKFRDYYNFSSIPYDPVPIGTGDYTLDPAAFDALLASNPNNRVDTLSLGLRPDYGQRLFDLAKSGSEDFTTFTKFNGIFKGLAIRSATGSKVIGLNPALEPQATNSSKTRLRLFYTFTDTEGATKKGLLDFSLFTVSGGAINTFSRLEADRSGTDLQNQPKFEAFTPAGGRGFVQAGVPVYARLDFGNFYSFLDTLPLVAFNSVELVVPTVTQPTPLPGSLELRIMREDASRFLRVRRTTTIPGALTGRVGFGTGYNLDTLLLPLSDPGSAFTLSRSSGSTEFNGFLTSFAQSLSIAKRTNIPYRYFGLSVPIQQEKKSVSRASFALNAVKLRIYYTKPTVTTNP